MRARQTNESLARSIERQAGFIETLRRRMTETRDAIEAVYARHFPDAPTPDDQRMRLGNFISSSETFMWCKECRTPWPCKSWHDCRAIYSATYGSSMGEKRYVTPHLIEAERPREGE